VRAPALAAALLALALAGCGLGAGEGSSNVAVTVTDGFGSRTVGQRSYEQTPGSETVMRLLQRGFKVSTRYGGGFVQSIDGLAGGSAGGRPTDWFYYVNGIEAPRGAAATRLRPGDRVWWDRHQWGAAMRVPAVVGSFPEPFRHGISGSRLPVRLECEQPAGVACREAQSRLAAAGVRTGSAVLGTNSQGRLLRVLVGHWPAVRRNQELRAIEAGPQRSGVYARMSPDGRRLTVLDGGARAVRALGPGAGLVAATRPAEEEDGKAGATWVVTGTDDRGVLAAARALTEGDLGDHFALAIDASGLAVPLPDVRPGVAAG
jgi:hypothetical protein